MILGIDPGMTGALALVTADGALVSVWDIPSQPKAKGKGNEINGYLLADIFKDIIEVAADHGHKIEVMMEMVGPQPRDSRPAAFKFGDSFGVLRGAVCCNYLPMRLVSPAVWKRYQSLLKKDKTASRMLAISKWPAMRDLFIRVKDADRAEAALIAEFGLTVAGWGHDNDANKP